MKYGLLDSPIKLTRNSIYALVAYGLDPGTGFYLINKSDIDLHNDYIKWYKSVECVKDCNQHYPGVSIQDKFSFLDICFEDLGTSGSSAKEKSAYIRVKRNAQDLNDHSPIYTTTSNVDNNNDLEIDNKSSTHLNISGVYTYKNFLEYIPKIKLGPDELVVSLDLVWLLSEGFVRRNIQIENGNRIRWTVIDNKDEKRTRIEDIHCYLILKNFNITLFSRVIYGNSIQFTKILNSDDFTYYECYAGEFIMSGNIERVGGIKHKVYSEASHYFTDPKEGLSILAGIIVCVVIHTVNAIIRCCMCCGKRTNLGYY